VKIQMSLSINSKKQSSPQIKGKTHQADERHCESDMWLKECKDGTKIYKTYGRIRRISCDHFCQEEVQCNSYLYNEESADCALVKVSDGDTKDHGISGPLLKLLEPTPKMENNDSAEEAEDCSEFTFAGCIDHSIHTLDNAEQCKSMCQATGQVFSCNSFFHDKDSSVCWLDDHENPRDTVQSICKLHRGRVDPHYEDSSKYDECLSSKASAHKKCWRGNCDLKWLAEEIQFDNPRPRDEKGCKDLCFRYFVPDGDVCTHYEYNSENFVHVCKMFNGDKALAGSTSCSAIVATKSITKDEIEECYNDQGKPIGKKIHISGTASGGVAQSAARKNL